MIKAWVFTKQSFLSNIACSEYHYTLLFHSWACLNEFSPKSYKSLPRLVLMSSLKEGMGGALEKWTGNLDSTYKYRSDSGLWYKIMRVTKNS